MTTSQKLLGLLTAPQMEVLRTLSDLHKQIPNRYWRPRDLGAFRSSSHTLLLFRLEAKGYVEKALVPGQRQGFQYRITSAGLDVVALITSELDEG